MYRKLKRTWSHSEAHHIPNFNKVFPELKRLSREEMCDRFIELNMDFYYEKKEPVKPLLRLTLPFALILFLLMFLWLPFNFLITGEWGYSLGKNNRILNWFKSLKLQ